MPPTPAEPVELDLLRKWREPVTSRRLLRDGLGSLAVHALAILLFLLAPEVELTRDAPEISYDLKRSVKLTLPRYFEPTQTAPNHGKVKPELDERSAAEGAQSQTRRFRPPAPAPGLAQPTAASLVEAPQIDLPQIEGPRSEPGALTASNLPSASGATESRAGKCQAGKSAASPWRGH